MIVKILSMVLRINFMCKMILKSLQSFVEKSRGRGKISKYLIQIISVLRGESYFYDQRLLVF